MFEDLPQITVLVTIESPTQKFIEQTINLCDWMEDPRTAYLLSIFRNYFEKHYNPKLFVCPIEEGFYVVAEPREYLTNVESFLPAFIPLRGNVNVKLEIETTISSKVEHVITITETIAFI